ncbi:MAG: guanylate kinase [Candidatus Omnitrophota bacterium]
MKRTRSRVFIVSGPSGSGKTTICQKVLKETFGLAESVSCTTRRPRREETDGVDYEFVSRDYFLKGINEGAFLEYAEVFGNLYGTPKKSVEKLLGEGKDVLLCIDVQGASQVKKNIKDAILIFIVPPSFDDLEKRLINRSSETAAQIKERLKTAKKELKQANFYDYTVVNDNVEAAERDLKAIILDERNRRVV